MLGRLERCPDTSTPGAGRESDAIAGLRLSTLAFLLSCAVVLALGILVAVHISTAGTWADSPNNLDTARNLALGRGFVSNMVTQLAVRQPLPVPEAVRPPGIPFVYGLLFLLTGGLNVGAAVVLNTLVVVAGAFAIRAVVRSEGGGWVGDVVGALFVISHHIYFITWTVNNAWLVLLTSLSLLLLSANDRRRLDGWRLACCLGALAAAGFYMKQTALLGFVPFGIAVMLTDGARPMRSRYRDAVVVGLVFLAASSPYWVYNIVEYGDPMFHPYAAYRLYIRYNLMPVDQILRLVLFDKPAMTYADLAARIGIRGIVHTELVHLRSTMLAILKLNPAVLMLAAASPWLADARGKRHVWIMLPLALPVVADVLLALPEPRYMWPLWPMMLYAAWLTIRGAMARADARSAGVRWGVARPLLIATSFAIALPLAIRDWGKDAIEAAEPAPAFAAAARSIPRDAVTLSAHPWSMGFFLDRTFVRYPIGGRTALAAVEAQYAPGYLLVTETHPVDHDFRPDELRLIDHAEGWSLYRIRRVEKVGVAARE